MKFWDALQAAEPQISARVRAAIFLIAQIGVLEAHSIAEALVWPGSEVWIKRAGVVCSGIALLVRAGDKTPAAYKAPQGFARLWLLPALALLALLASCAFFKKVGPQIGPDAAQCAGKATLDISPTEVQPAVDDALHRDWAGAEAELISMAGQWGFEFITCLVSDLQAQYNAVLDADAGTPAPIVAPAVSPKVAQRAMHERLSGTVMAWENAGLWLSKRDKPKRSGQ